MSSRRRLYQMATPLMRAWWRGTRAMTLGVRVLAVDREGRVGLVRHTYAAGWFFPGGGVERGERAQDAALREFQEETGAQAAGPLRLVGVFANFSTFAGDHVILFRTEVDATPERAPDREIEEVLWTRPEDAPRDTTAATRRRLAEVFAGACVSPDW